MFKLTSWSLKKQKKSKLDIFGDIIDNVKGLIYNKTNIHHSHMTRGIFGYCHSYCNFKVRENRDKVREIAHNLFPFDFLLLIFFTISFWFFLLKGIRAGSWRTRDTSIGGRNPTNIHFANIGIQVTFIDTIKYFQQSLGVLARKDCGKKRM